VCQTVLEHGALGLVSRDFVAYVGVSRELVLANVKSRALILAVVVSRALLFVASAVRLLNGHNRQVHY